MRWLVRMRPTASAKVANVSAKIRVSVSGFGASHRYRLVADGGVPGTMGGSRFGLKVRMI